jgi:hypothetical protein
MKTTLLVFGMLPILSALKDEIEMAGGFNTWLREADRTLFVFGAFVGDAEALGCIAIHFADGFLLISAVRYPTALALEVPSLKRLN